MLHGEVVSLVRYTDHTALTVKDAQFGDHLCLRVQERDAQTGVPVTIGLGDFIAWEGATVLWTSKSLLTVAPGIGCPQAWDVRLPRVEY